MDQSQHLEAMDALVYVNRADQQWKGLVIGEDGNSIRVSPLGAPSSETFSDCQALNQEHLLLAMIVPTVSKRWIYHMLYSRLMHSVPYVYRPVRRSNELLHVCHLVYTENNPFTIDSSYNIMLLHITKSTPWLSYLNYVKQTSVKVLNSICANYTY